MAASLTPVYKKLDAYEDEHPTDGIELEEVATTSNYYNKNEENISLTSSAELNKLPAEKEEEETCDQKKCKRAKRVAKCCRCTLAATCLLLTIVVVVLTIITGVVAFRVKQCVFPHHYAVQEFQYAPSELDHLSVFIPTGMISVHTCSQAKNVTIKVTKGAKSGDLIEQIKVDGVLLDRTASISVTSPSFDFQNCQITRVEVTIPSRTDRAISLAASATAGYIRLDTNHYTFSDVDLLVSAGVIKATHVRSANTVKAHAQFGGVMARDVKADGNMTLHSETGGMCVSRVTSRTAAIHVGTGYLRMCESTLKEKLNVDVSLGMGMIKDIKSPSVIGQVTYGNLQFTPNANFNGNFKLQTSYGHLTVTSPPMGPEPTLSKKTDTLVEGNSLHGLAGDTLSQVELSSYYGNVRLHLLDP